MFRESGLVASNFFTFLSDLVFFVFLLVISLVSLSFATGERYSPFTPSTVKYAFTANGLVGSIFLALCSTLLLLVFFGVIFLVAIFIPLFQFDF